MLPALPTGMQSAQFPPRSSWISNAAVFWPSMRNSLTELTSAIGCLSVSSRTSSSAWSKLPFSEITRAPWISVCASLPFAIFPSGHDHRAGDARARRVAAALAAVLPVEAQITAFAPSRTAAETAQVMPRSLKEPVGFAPSSFRRTVGADELRETRRAQQRRGALLQADERIARGERQTVAVAFDQRTCAHGARRALDARELHLGDVGAQLAHTNSSSITRIVRGGARTNVELGDPLDRAAKPRLEHRVGDHHQPRVLADPALDDRLDRDIVVAEDIRHRREHPGLVGDLEVQVERVSTSATSSSGTAAPAGARRRSSR